MIKNFKSHLASVYERMVCGITPCCRDMTRLISESHERPLGPMLRFRMKLHYGICIWCVRYRDQIDLIRAFIRRFPEMACDAEAKLSDDARQRIREKLRELQSGASQD